MVDMEMASWGRISEQGWRKGPWTPEEDKLLMEYVRQHGEGRWSCVSKCAGLNRSGKSCRLRWVNYLRPGLKKGHITPQEEGIIIELHALWGNKWSTIARYLPGRTDNEIKNYWRTHFKKRSKASNDPNDDSKHDKTEILLRQLQAEQNERIKYEEDDKEKGSSQSTETPYNANVVNNVENDHQLPLMQPMMDQDHHGVVGLSDNYNLIPVDMSYSSLWSGLWNVDDHHHHHQSGDNCSKMAIQNQAKNVGNCSGRGGDGAMSYMQSGGYIF